MYSEAQPQLIHSFVYTSVGVYQKTVTVCFAVVNNDVCVAGVRGLPFANDHTPNN